MTVSPAQPHALRTLWAFLSEAPRLSLCQHQ